MRHVATGLGIAAWSLALAGSGGCTRISIAPSCPEELAVGQSGDVAAHEQNPGAIPAYLWEVFPPERGRFDDPEAPSTSFSALQEGQAVIRLTASDGLFQVIDECQTTVTRSTSVVVSLEVDPASPAVGQQAVLRCTSVGPTSAVTRTLEQISGVPVTLAVVSEGEATFTAAQAGVVAFQCVGAGEQGQQSVPSVVAVSVAPGPAANDGGGAGDGGGRPPSRPGGRRG